MDDMTTKSARDPRNLLKRMRLLMAVQENAQARLDHLTALIAEEAGWDVCSIYLARPSNALELCATFALCPAARAPWRRPMPASTRLSPTSRKPVRSHSIPSSVFRSCAAAAWLVS